MMHDLLICMILFGGHLYDADGFKPCSSLSLAVFHMQEQRLATWSTSIGKRVASQVGEPSKIAGFPVLPFPFGATLLKVP